MHPVPEMCVLSTKLFKGTWLVYLGGRRLAHMRGQSTRLQSPCLFITCLPKNFQTSRPEQRSALSVFNTGILQEILAKQNTGVVKKISSGVHTPSFTCRHWPTAPRHGALLRTTELNLALNNLRTIHEHGIQCGSACLALPLEDVPASISRYASGMCWLALRCTWQ